MTAAPSVPGPVGGARFDLGQALGAVLRRYLESARHTAGEVPGGPRGFQVLSIAAEGRCSNQATIAAALGIDRTVMTYLVDDLEAAGLVERRPDPADRRARQVVLRPEGAKVLHETTERIQEVEDAVLGRLSAQEADVFRSLLARVASDAPVDHSLCTAEPPTC